MGSASPSTSQLCTPESGDFMPQKIHHVEQLDVKASLPGTQASHQRLSLKKLLQSRESFLNDA